MTAPRESNCRRCGDPIKWATHARTGRPMPLNAAPVPAVFAITSDGQAAAAIVYTSHFATCPHADEFRKPKTAATP
jgi:hypothetical protein